MPFATGGNARIRTNIPSLNAYNQLESSSKNIALRQLRLSTGKRINSASDDVAGYITSRALLSRNSALQASLNAILDAQNVSNILMDAMQSINQLLTQIKDATAQASSGALGTDEKVALAKSAYRLAEQIQTTADSTVFGNNQMLSGAYTANFVIGLDAENNLIDLEIDMSTDNVDFNIASQNFNVNSETATTFAGVEGLNLNSLDEVDSNNLGLFANENIGQTLVSISEALNNVNKVASFLGGISVRLTSQEDLLRNQIVNYDAAISRIQDADVAKEQLELIKAQFLQQSSLITLSQANQNPSTFLQLLQS